MIRTILNTLLAAVWLFLLSACGGEKPKQVPKYTIEQFMESTSIFGSSFSPDESEIVFSSNESGVDNAYLVPVGGGAPQQITNSTDDAVMVLSFLPRDRRILFRSDQGGNELFHIYLRSEDGSVRDLTPWEGARSTFHGWSQDERSFFITSNRRDARFMDIYEVSLEDLEPVLFYQNEQGYFPGPVSDDRRYVALLRVITQDNTDIVLFDKETGEETLITPHDGDVVYQPATFSPDSQALYILTDEDSEFTYLSRYHLDSGEMEVVEKADWDILYTYFSRNGRYRVSAVNANARTEIRVYETATSERVLLLDLPAGDITSVNISRSETLMSFYLNGATAPNNLFVYDFETAEYRQLTNTLNPEIDRANLSEAETVQYTFFDGLEIPALFYRPQQASNDNQVPALVWVHGGPGGQSRIGYSPLIQYLVNNGYAVLAVNNRGSSGYGKSFFRMDDRKHGDVDLKDCIEAKKFLSSTGIVDQDKIGIIGGSYGGYMVLAALAFEPEAFAVGVDIFGVSNWLRTLQSIPAWWEAQREALYKELGNPETDEEYLRQISPLFHAANIRKPLIVLQGANDPRVLKVESDEIVEAVRANGVPVEYLVFEDEGHGFNKKENEVRGFRAILDFLNAHLLGDSWTEQKG